MKKLFLLFASFITLLFIGCEKEDPQSATNDDLLKSNIKSNKVFDDNNKNFNINEPPKVFVELITANIESNIKTYSLNISLKQLKSTSFLFGYPVGYTTSNDFIG